MADKTTELERIYTIPLRSTKALPRSRLAQYAVRDVRRYLERHMKSDQVWVDPTVNESLWSRGKFSIPSRIRVRATRFSDGVVEVTLPEAATTGSVRAVIAERREKASEKQILKPAPPEEEDEEGGAVKGPGSTRPLTDLEGIGPATAEKLDKAGLTSVAALAAASSAAVVKETGLPEDKVKGWIESAKKMVQDETAAAKADADAAETPAPAAEKAGEGKDEEAKGGSTKADAKAPPAKTAKGTTEPGKDE